jgi:signal transduction histidine kinase
MRAATSTSEPHGQSVEDPVRLEALQETRLLDSLPEESLDRYTRIAAAMLGTHISLVTLVDRNRQFFKSHTGLPEPLKCSPETPLSHSFCKYVIEEGQPLVVEDAREDPRVSDNPAVTELGVISYLGAPLRTRDGFLLGSFCVVGSEPRKWTLKDLDRLSDLAGAVMREIEFRELARTCKETLAAAAEEEQQHRYRLNQMLEGLRPPAATVASASEQLIANPSHLEPWQLDLLHRCNHSAKALLRATSELVDHELAEGESIGPLDTQTVSASILVRRAIRILRPLADDADVRIELEAPSEILPVEVDANKLERVLLTLLTNAIQCSTPASSVLVQFKRVENNGRSVCEITVNDRCPTVPEAEKEQIFRQCLKSPGFGGSSGLVFCRTVMLAHRGDIGVSDRPGGGRSFQCWLPLAASAPE